MKEGFSRKFYFLDGLVVLFVLFLDNHDVACCMLLINSPLPFFPLENKFNGKKHFQYTESLCVQISILILDSFFNA